VSSYKVDSDDSIEQLGKLPKLRSKAMRNNEIRRRAVSMSKHQLEILEGTRETRSDRVNRLIEGFDDLSVNRAIIVSPTKLQHICTL